MPTFREIIVKASELTPKGNFFLTVIGEECGNFESFPNADDIANAKGTIMLQAEEGENFCVIPVDNPVTELGDNSFSVDDEDGNSIEIFVYGYKSLTVF